MSTAVPITGIRERSRRRLPRGGALLLLPVLVFLLAFFVVPLLSMLSISAVDRAGELTLEHYRQLFGSGLILQILGNTFRISAWTTLVTVLLAYPVAYYLATGSRRMTNLLLVIVLLPFWTSILVRTFAWMVLLGRRGVVNSALASMGLTDVPVDMLYSFFSVIVSMVHALMPIAVLIILSAMQNIDRNLESAAATLGAERGHVFWRIYFPMSFPGVASAVLVTFIVSLGIFVQPALLGSPRETMIAQMIIRQIDEMFNWGMAGAIAVLVLAVSILVIIVFDRVLGVASIAGSTPGAGKGGASGPLIRTITAGLGWATVWLQRAIALVLPSRRGWSSTGPATVVKVASVLIIIFLAAPSFFLIPISFTSSSFLEWPPRGFSLQWYEAYFSSPIWRDATIRSILVGIATAIASLVIGVPAAFALTRSQFRLKGLALPYILLPLVAPNIIVALALFYFFADLGLVGTSVGLIIGHTVFSVPYVVLTMIATLQNYDQRLDQAAWTLGATRLTTFRLVTLPLIKVGFVTSFLFAFVRSFDELTVALFISSGLSTTLPKRMWSEAHFNVGPTLAAVSTILIVMVVLVLIVTELMNRRGSRN